MRKMPPRSLHRTGYEQYTAHVNVNTRAIKDVTEKIALLSEEAELLASVRWGKHLNVEAGVHAVATDQRVRRYTAVRAEIRTLRSRLRQLEGDKFILRLLAC